MNHEPLTRYYLDLEHMKEISERDFYAISGLYYALMRLCLKEEW
jgi:hypothetical protein